MSTALATPAEIEKLSGAANYHTLLSADNFDKFVDRMLAQGLPVGFDIESGYTGPDKEKAALLPFYPHWLLAGFSFTNSTDWACYVPVNHNVGENIDDPVRVARALWRLARSGLMVIHNLTFELKGVSRWLRDVLWTDSEFGKEIRDSKGLFPAKSDTMLLVWLSATMDPLRVGKDLKRVTKHLFNHQMVEFMDLFPIEETEMGPGTPKNKRKYVRFNTRNASSLKVRDYACEDAKWCLAIHQLLYDRVLAESEFIFQTEMAIAPVTVEMEMEGLMLDWVEISKKAAEVARFRDLMNEDIQAELSERTGELISINLASVPQLSELLYDKLKLPVKQRSKTSNAPSTSAKALAAIAKVDPVINRILEYRQVAKLYSAYLNKYETQLNYVGNGRAYPNHNQAGALTGRFSVDGVSYQQWPKPYKYELSGGATFQLNFRDLLISPEGFRIIGFDFSQVELRVLAGMANENALLQAFADGVDIHRATASNMKKIPLEDVTDEDRANGKTLNFAVVYGSGAQNIADMLSTAEHTVTKEEAQQMLDDYFAAFPKLKGWMDARVVEGHEQGFVNTLFGRKFKVWEYESPNNYIRSKGDRMCVNAPVQGGAADYMKIGMVRATKAIRKAEADGVWAIGHVRLVMTIHDALEFYVHESVETQTVINLINKAVSFPIQGLPEIRADWHEGYRWGSVIEIEMDVDKQITGYSIKKEKFDTIQDAYDWLDRKNLAVIKITESLASHNPDEEEDTVDLTESLTLTERTADTPSQRPDYEKIMESWNADRDKVEDDPTAAPPVEPQAPTQPGTPGADPSPYQEPDQKPNGDLYAMTPLAPGEEEPPWLHSPDWVDPAQQVQAHRIVVTMLEMPTADQYMAFQEYAAARPGVHTLVVDTPEGSLTFDTTHDITKADQPRLSLMLGGATVDILALEADSAAFAQDVGL